MLTYFCGDHEKHGPHISRPDFVSPHRCTGNLGAGRSGCAPRRTDRSVNMAEKYPELEKLGEVSNEMRTVSDFLDFLDYANNRNCSVRELRDLVYDWLGLDQKKIEAEQRHLLDEVRKLGDD